VYFTSIEELEDLNHDKSIEDESKMPWIQLIISSEDIEVIDSTCRCEESTTSNSPSNDTIMPFSCRISSKDSRIIGIFILRDEILSTESKSNNDYKLEKSLTENMLDHCFRYDILLSAVRFAVEKLISRLLGS